MRWTPLLAALVLTPLLACPSPTPVVEREATPCLDASIDRPAGVRERLDRLVAEHGRTGDRYDPAAPPVAIFDFDNTLIRNDIGTCSAHHLLLTDGLIAPADWSATSPYLTPEAVTALTRACGDHPPGAPLPTSTDPDCGGALVGVYLDRETPDGSPAFDGTHDRLRMKPRSAWWASMLAGQSAAELQRKVDVAIDAALAAEVGATRDVGAHTGLTAWIRVDERNHDLLRTLQAAGFDVWVVSASPHHVVVPFARRLGVPPDRVIGVQTLHDDDGTLTPRLAGCGPVADGEGSLMTFREGKRCWINKIIFGDDSAAALHSRAGGQRRQLFVAGDATTDLEMLQDASELRLVVDRHKPELMCHALSGSGGEWLVQPTFVQALPPRADPYPCSTTACVSSEGEAVACLAPDGSLIPDQTGP
jgi:phosphoserine phosphatase